jgi:hypothetical protein
VVKGLKISIDGAIVRFVYVVNASYAKLLDSQPTRSTSSSSPRTGTGFQPHITQFNCLNRHEKEKTRRSDVISFLEGRKWITTASSNERCLGLLSELSGLSSICQSIIQTRGGFLVDRVVRGRSRRICHSLGLDTW